MNEYAIYALYHNKVKRGIEYFKKYENIERYLDNSVIKSMLTGRDYPRVPCILDFAEWTRKYNIEPKNSICTCPDDAELNFIKLNNLDLIEYNSNSGSGDLHLLDLKEKYDFFLFSQTLEHLHNPHTAMGKISEHMNPGGYVFTSVPTINIPHMTPIHFWGVYPMGLATLFEDSGLEVLEVGQWGNLDYINYIFKNNTWPDYQYLIKAGNGKIINSERHVAQCWCLGRKR